MMHPPPHHNPHRRVFRGRAGPTDRRLPKYQARRRKVVPPPSSGVVDQEPDRVNHNEKEEDHHQLVEDHDQGLSSSSSSTSSSSFKYFHNESSEKSLEQTFQETKHSNEEETTAANDAEAAVVADCDGITTTTTTGFGGDGSSHANANAACEQELQHLGERIQNIRLVMQRSSSSKEAGGGALAIPSNYQHHVLGAVHNTVTEWNAIQRHYPAEINITMEHHNHVAKSIGLALFELIQQALQCGPLAGAKPGYFKRCGSDVAQMVYDFLNTLPLDPNHEEDFLSLSLYLTEKQVGAIEKWKDAAKKAAEKETLPSKTVALQQQKAQQNVNKKRELKVKKYK